MNPTRCSPLGSPKKNCAACSRWPAPARNATRSASGSMPFTTGAPLPTSTSAAPWPAPSKPGGPPSKPLSIPASPTPAPKGSTGSSSRSSAPRAGSATPPTATVGYGFTAPGNTGQQQRHQDHCPLKIEEPINATSVAVEGRAPSQRKPLPPSKSHSPAAAHDSPAATHEAPQHQPMSSPPDDPHRPRPDEPTDVTTRPTRRPSPRPTRSPPTATHNPTGSPTPAPPRAHAPHEGASKIGPSLHPPLRTEPPHQTRGGSYPPLGVAGCSGCIKGEQQHLPLSRRIALGLIVNRTQYG